MKVKSSKQALEDSQRFAAMFPGLVSVIADLAQIESIEQLADAAEKRLADANTALGTKQDEIAAANIAHTNTMRDADAELASKVAAGDVALKVQSDEMMAAKTVAQAEIEQMKQAALFDINANKVAAQGALDDLAAQILTQQNALAATNARLATTTASLTAAQKQLDDINAQKQALLAKLG